MNYLTKERQQNNKKCDMIKKIEITEAQIIPEIRSLQRMQLNSSDAVSDVLIFGAVSDMTEIVRQDAISLNL